MKLSQFVARYRSAIIQSRSSPISRTGSFLTFGLLAVGITASIATKLTLASIPNILPLLIGILVLDALSQFAPQNRFVEAVQMFLHGLSYLIITILCAVLAAYAMQRFAFPLQDRLFAHIDLALGLNWFDYARWVDRHPAVQRLFHFAYDTIQIQIALPLVVLAFSNRRNELRVYLLTFALALAVTITISALMPAAGPIAAIDRTAFHILQFTGATPLDHLTRLREAGPLILTEPPGGIATFPSFHATIAILTPLILRNFPRILVVVLVLDAAMLGATVTEGAHYFCDLLAGGGIAFLAYALAKRVIRAEDRSIRDRSSDRVGRQYPPSLANSR
jgi:membrane-associated phospholipid phosphatase